jgi:CubicO group peptidase (beta-lactamase class C family)
LRLWVVALRRVSQRRETLATSGIWFQLAKFWLKSLYFARPTQPFGRYQLWIAPDQQAQAVRIAHIEDDLRVIDERGEDTPQRHSIAERMKTLGVPGLSVTVFDDGKIIWSLGYGVRDRAAGDPVDERTVFQAASISKPVTSAALFRMIEEKFGLSGEGRARRYRHNGGNAGFTCYAVAFTDIGRGVVFQR